MSPQLDASPRETEMRAQGLRFAEAMRVADASAEGQRDDWADGGNAHEAPAKLVASYNLHDHLVQLFILGPQLWLRRKRQSSSYHLNKAQLTLLRPVTLVETTDP